MPPSSRRAAGVLAPCITAWSTGVPCRPQSPYYDKKFETAKTIIVYSAAGGRSALAGKVLKDTAKD